MEENRAYVTVLSTNEYLVGVLALNESLKNVKSKYKLVTLVNKSISEFSKEILKMNDIEILKVETFELPKWIIDGNNKRHSNWNYTFDKLSIFELTQYDKIVFLDSDMFIRNNIDELFDKPSISATVDRCDTVLVKESYQKLTSGLMVIKPEKNVISKFVNIIRNENIREKYKSIGDQDIIQLYVSDWDKNKELHLEVKYNMFFLDIEYYINKRIYSLDDISVIHFITSKKPWQYNKQELLTKYLDWLEEVSLKDYENNHLKETKENIEYGRENKKKILEEYSKILYKSKEEIELYKK